MAARILNQDTVEALARQFSPVLRFHPDERFLPLLAEAWLTTTTDGVWPDDPHDPDNGPAGARAVKTLFHPSDLQRRGGAFCLPTSPALTAVGPVAGLPLHIDRPVALDPEAFQAILEAGAEVFYNIGGWRNGPLDFTEGSLEYLEMLGSELASAISPSLPWRPLDSPEKGVTPEGRRLTTPVTPWSWIPQPVNITMYCEVSWGGAWQLRDQLAGTNDYGGATDLNGTIAFTYYLLYGGRKPGASGRISEGQWEAITLFFRADVVHEAAAAGLIAADQMIEDTPFAVVVSQGVNRDTPGEPQHLGDHRRYDACEHLGDHPVIYVSLGSHRNLFAPAVGETFDPSAFGPHAPDTSLHDSDTHSMDGVEGYLLASGILFALSVLATAAYYFTAAMFFFVVALILLIMWIVSACTEAADRDAGKNVGPRPEPLDAPPTGPQAGSGDEAPAAPAPPPTNPGGGGPTAGVGLPNTGSPSGNETTFPDIRIVERLFVAGASREHTAYPSFSVMENPAWWDYRGRWGIQVSPNLSNSGTWESGWQRIDDAGRDWGYYNGLELLRMIHTS